MNSSELLRNSGARPPFYELDAVSDENSRGKLQNVVANRCADGTGAAAAHVEIQRFQAEQPINRAKPYFSFYDLGKLVESFGSVPATPAAFDAFRAKAVAGGLSGLHLNAVVWGQLILPGEKVPTDSAKLVRDLGLDSVTSYVWIHHFGMPQPQTDYDVVRDGYFRYWDKAHTQFAVPGERRACRTMLVTAAGLERHERRAFWQRESCVI